MNRKDSVMRILCFSLLLLLVVPAMSASPKKGTLVGHVDVGPLSPVEKVGEKKKVPPDVYKRYQVMVTQHGPQNGQMKSMLMRVVAHVKLSATGDYTVDLDPGVYQVSVTGDA